MTQKSNFTTIKGEEKKVESCEKIEQEDEVKIAKVFQLSFGENTGARSLKEALALHEGLQVQ